MTLVALFTIHMNLHTMEFPLIFGETNFVEVPKICEIHKIYGPQRKHPMVVIIKPMKHTRLYKHDVKTITYINYSQHTDTS